jgi:hypothetical protein
VSALARLGFVSRALLYAVIAVLCVRVALGRDDGPLDKRGALTAIAEQPFGRLLVVALAVGFAGYALWRLARAALPTPEDRERPARRFAHLGSGLLYGGLLVGTLRLLTGTAGDDRHEADLTAQLMALPGGPVLVALGGVLFLGAAGWSVRRAVTPRKRRQLEASTPPKVRRAAATSAAAAFFVRAVVQGLIAAFLLKAAWEHDPEETVGLDGALRTVAGAPWGDVLLCVLAAGVLARGALAGIEAGYRKTR